MRKSIKSGVVAAVLALVGGAGVAVMASKGEAPKKGDDKAKAALQFVPAEVVKPVRTAMPAPSRPRGAGSRPAASPRRGSSTASSR